MKKLLLAILLALPGALLAQDTFTVNIKTAFKTPPPKIRLVYYIGARRFIDSAMINKGTYHFSGTLKEPVMAFFIAGKLTDMLKIMLDKGAINIEFKDSLKYATVTGPQATSDYQRYEELMAPELEKYKKLSLASYSENRSPSKDTVRVNSLMKQSQASLARWKAAQIKYIRDNPDSYVSPTLLEQIAIADADFALVESLYNNLSSRVRKAGSAQQVKSLIDKKKMLSIGNPAPDFTQTDMNDHRVKLSDFKGKYVLVDFWASWCVPCRAENPRLVKIYTRFKDKEFTILGVSLDRPGKKADWLAAIKADGLTWTQVSDLKGADNAAAVMYGISSIPQNFLIDKEGKIIAANLKGDELEKILNKKLN